MRILIFGKPGAGKGTISKELVDRFGLSHVSTGDLLRKEISSGSELGVVIASYIDDGNLIPNDLCVKIMEKHLPDDNFILDGFPRTIKQAEVVNSWDIKWTCILDVFSSDDCVKERLCGRRIDEETGEIYHILFRPPPEGARVYQRKDDRKEVLDVRLRNHKNLVQPAIDFFSKHPKYVQIASENSMTFEELFDVVMNKIEN